MDVPAIQKQVQQNSSVYVSIICTIIMCRILNPSSRGCQVKLIDENMKSILVEGVKPQKSCLQELYHVALWLASNFL